MVWYNVFSFIIIVISIFLILIVLVQNSKGGGLAAGFTSSNQYMGVRKTADFLEKATWTLASGLLVLCVISSIALRSGGDNIKKSILDKTIENTAPTSNQPPQQGVPDKNGKPAQQVPDKKK